MDAREALYPLSHTPNPVLFFFYMEKVALLEKFGITQDFGVSIQPFSLPKEGTSLPQLGYTAPNWLGASFACLVTSASPSLCQGTMDLLLECDRLLPAWSGPLPNTACQAEEKRCSGAMSSSETTWSLIWVKGSWPGTLKACSSWAWTSSCRLVTDGTQVPPLRRTPSFNSHCLTQHGEAGLWFKGQPGLQRDSVSKRQTLEPNKTESLSFWDKGCNSEEEHLLSMLDTLQMVKIQQKGDVWWNAPLTPCWGSRGR